MLNFKKWTKSGEPMIWLTGGAVALSLIMVLGLLLLIAFRGMGHFWPKSVVTTVVTTATGERVPIGGEIHGRERVTAAIVRESGFDIPEDVKLVSRFKFKVANRDLYGQDFRWVVGAEGMMDEWQYPEEIAVFERTEWGDFIGFPLSLLENGEPVAVGEGLWSELQTRIQRADDLRNQISNLEDKEIGDNSRAQEKLRLEERGLRLRGIEDGPEHEAIANRRAELQEAYGEIASRRAALSTELGRDVLIARSADDREHRLPLATIIQGYRPNQMSVFEKIGFYVSEFKNFIFGYPREANTEGGIFPAIFGTVTMVILMSIMVTPVGVLAAIYLREYAKQGPLVRLIRICVNNLAGVPSIVYGVFGVGFFVYFLGGNIDQLFFPEALPAPTFGTPGLFWASLTLALLTLPVVIVSTEEGLTRIPKEVRDGSLALGATKAETLWRVIVPMSAPAMMTGLILAVARAAGEVAPLMLVGVVKLAPTLPIDDIFPFVHMERKFMHLGFHIYDVGFQSPNVDAGRPLVYATALILVLIIVVLNLVAIHVRNKLREQYKISSD